MKNAQKKEREGERERERALLQKRGSSYLLSLPLLALPTDSAALLLLSLSLSLSPVLSSSSFIHFFLKSMFPFGNLSKPFLPTTLHLLGKKTKIVRFSHLFCASIVHSAAIKMRSFWFFLKHQKKRDKIFEKRNGADFESPTQSFIEALIPSTCFLSSLPERVKRREKKNPQRLLPSEARAREREREREFCWRDLGGEREYTRKLSAKAFLRCYDGISGSVEAARC